VAPTRRARVALTAALRQARRDADLTGAALAQRLGAGWGQPKVSKIESGRQLPTTTEIRAWAQATATNPDQLLALYGRALHEYETLRDSYNAEGGPDRQQDAHAAVEHAATLINGFQANIVHGLLQTPAYARNLLHLPGGPKDHGATDDEIDRMVAARMRRAAVLYEPGRQITLIVGEAALHNRVGSTEVMTEQRDHIARLASTATHATIAIVPFTAFPVLVHHGWDQRDNIVTVETTAGDLEIADPTEVAKYERWARLLLESAATGDDAVHLCRQITEVSTAKPTR
jgi:transcriptional regulator with XRE-family HTH domain